MRRIVVHDSGFVVMPVHGSRRAERARKRHTPGDSLRAPPGRRRTARVRSGDRPKHAREQSHLERECLCSGNQHRRHGSASEPVVDRLGVTFKSGLGDDQREASELEHRPGQRGDARRIRGGMRWGIRGRLVLRRRWRRWARDVRQLLGTDPASEDVPGRWRATTAPAGWSLLRHRVLPGVAQPILPPRWPARESRLQRGCATPAGRAGQPGPRDGPRCRTAPRCA